MNDIDAVWRTNPAPIEFTTIDKCTGNLSIGERGKLSNNYVNYEEIGCQGVELSMLLGIIWCGKDFSVRRIILLAQTTIQLLPKAA